MCLSLVLFPVVSQALNVNQVTNPRSSNGTWVSDMANILSDRTESQLNQMIDSLEQTNGTEIAVVTVSETKPAATPKKFTTELFNTWKIGKAGQDNGVLFLVSVGDRRVEIETGYGVEGVLPDARVGNIIQTEITPRFKQKDFDGGVINGTNALVKVLIGEDFTSVPATPSHTVTKIKPNHNLKFHLIVFGLVGWFYYYRIALNSLKPIKISPIGYSRNKYFDHLTNWKIYALLYLSTFFFSAFVLIPLLTSLSQELSIAVFAGLHIGGFLFIKPRVPSLKILLLLLLLPILLIMISSLAILSNVGILIAAPVIEIIYRLKKDKKMDFIRQYMVIFGSPTVGAILLMLCGIYFMASLVNTAEAQMAIWGLWGSVSLSYLTSEYLKQKFQYSKTIKIDCSTCNHPLNRLDNQHLQKYLKSAEKTAQQLNSVRFKGWQCPNCKGEKSKIHICADVVAKNSDKYSNCPTCQEITVVHQSAIIEEATEYSSGMLLKQYSCQCCEYTHEEEKNIPRLSSSSSNSSSYDSYSSSSDSSSSDSFGDGNSGGGGAGSSW